MTDKATLEEIEAISDRLAKGPWGLLTEHPTKDGLFVREVILGKRYGVAWIQSAEHCGPDGLTAGELIAASEFIEAAPRLLEIAQEQAAEIARLKQYTCEACADADSCDRVGRAANRQCAAFRVVTKK
jgi:hypothetical protein